MPPFLVCIHDASPVHARETRTMLRTLSPLVGRRLSMGVVPDWHGEWQLAEHPEYCRMIQEASGELLLHGYFHRRRRGTGPVAWLTDSSDEMNGLDSLQTAALLERGQREFAAAFGSRARGFLPPAWQRGHVHRGNAASSTQLERTGLEHLLGFFSLQSSEGRRIPLATWTWDCGRWRTLGHVGHGVGRVLHSTTRGVPVLAIHPADIARGFWPTILRLVRELIDRGFEPSTPARLLWGSDA